MADSRTAIKSRRGSAVTVDFNGRAVLASAAFAERFKETTGFSLGDYAIRWRMRLPMKRLRSGNKSASAIGASLGYLSDSAFSSAFKKVVGKSPRAYREELERDGPRLATQFDRGDSL